MGKIVLVLVLVAGGYWLYQSLESKGTVSGGSSALKTLEAKKSQDFTKAE